MWQNKYYRYSVVARSMVSIYCGYCSAVLLCCLIRYRWLCRPVDYFC